MLRRFFDATLLWLGLCEGLAGLAGLRGLLWSDVRLRGAAGWALLAAMARRGSRGPVLAVALVPGMLLQLGLACLRNLRLDPLLRLHPGRYPDRSISRVDVPTAHGPVPALEIVPAGGAQAALCIAHGSGCDKTFYMWGLVDELIGRGFALLLIDLDGHGESPRAQAFPAIVENIAGCVGWLRKRYPWVGVVGNSLGGGVAARAIAAGVRVEALALLAAPISVRLTERDRRRVVRQEALRLARPGLLPMLRDGSPYTIARAWRTTGIRAEIGTWDLFDALDLPGSLGRIAVDPARPPLFTLYAANDAIVPRRDAERVRVLLPPGATFHLLPWASHISLPVERRTLHLLGEWLEGVFKGG